MFAGAVAELPGIMRRDLAVVEARLHDLVVAAAVEAEGISTARSVSICGRRVPIRCRLEDFARLEVSPTTGRRRVPHVIPRVSSRWLRYALQPGLEGGDVGGFFGGAACAVALVPLLLGGALLRGRHCQFSRSLLASRS